MRSFLFALGLVVALLAVSVSALRSEIQADATVYSPTPFAVTVPYKWCGSSNDSGSVSSLASNEYPPMAGDPFVLNITGSLSQNVTSGGYAVGVTINGEPGGSLAGDLSDLAPLPWLAGGMNLTYSADVPADAPSGTYVVQLKANDQDSNEIFCFSMSFDMVGNDVVANGDRALADSAQAGGLFRFQVNPLAVPARKRK